MADLEVALQNALELAQEGWSYAGDYFIDKHFYPERYDELQRIHNGGAVPRVDREVPSMWPYPGWESM